MASNLYNSLPQSQNPMDMIQQKLNALGLQNGIKNPEETVRSLLNSGRMTQQQFNYISMMANQIMGRK